MIGTTRPTTARVAAEGEALVFSPSNSSVKDAGGIKPRNAPQQARIKATCSFGVKLSSDDNHQIQEAVPIIPATSQTCRKLRRWNQVVRNVVEAIVSAVGTISQP